jgi:hypothetical protein
MEFQPSPGPRPIRPHAPRSAMTETWALAALWLGLALAATLLSIWLST